MGLNLFKNAFIIVGCMSFCYGHAMAATNLGVVGKVYAVKERDALEEIESKAKTVNWQKELAKIKPEKSRPKNLVDLPRVKKSNSFLVDITHTLDMDIPDGRGGILYPKGYSFNPLDYLPLTSTMVVINANDKDQVNWFKKSHYAGRIQTKLLITDGSFVDTAKAVKQPAFYAVERLLERFGVKAVPSVVIQDGRFIRVEEVFVPKSKKD